MKHLKKHLIQFIKKNKLIHIRNKKDILIFPNKLELQNYKNKIIPNNYVGLEYCDKKIYSFTWINRNLYQDFENKFIDFSFDKLGLKADCF